MTRMHVIDGVVTLDFFVADGARIGRCRDARAIVGRERGSGIRFACVERSLT